MAHQECRCLPQRDAPRSHKSNKTGDQSRVDQKCCERTGFVAPGRRRGACHRCPPDHRAAELPEADGRSGNRSRQRVQRIDVPGRQPGRHSRTTFQEVTGPGWPPPPGPPGNLASSSTARVLRRGMRDFTGWSFSCRSNSGSGSISGNCRPSRLATTAHLQDTS